MTQPRPLARRTLLAGVGAAAAAAALPRPAQAAPAPTELRNPLVRQRADVQVFRHTDGLYYLTGSVPEYDRLIVRKARTLAGLRTAREAVVWRRPVTGPLGGYIWAPELHRFGGAWNMYFAAGDSDDPFRIRTYVLQSRSLDPYDATWDLVGQLETPWDTFTLDATSFVHRGVRYLCWAQNEPGIATNSNLYLAPLATPTTLARPPVRLTVPTLEWEVQGFRVNEAPALLARNGRLFLTYSASATDDRYVLGLLTADADADVMDAASWSKSPVPVFTSSTVTEVYGPGHNSFTVDEQGRDVLVYHGRSYREIDGDPLFDPDRHTRVQRLYYRADGTPDLGIPVGNGRIPDRLSPVGAPGVFLRHEGLRVLVGRGALPTTQFRLVDGAAGAGTYGLQPVDLPGTRVRRARDGSVSLVRVAGADATLTSFRRRPGLSDRGGVSFEAVGAAGTFLQRTGDAVRVAPAGTAAARAAATWLVT